MKIIVFAHSGGPGGAEHALRHLVAMLAERHEVDIILPDLERGEAAYYTERGHRCYHLPVPFALPDVSGALLHYARLDLADIVRVLREGAYDLALSNTLAILHGAWIARYLGIPHLHYVHEYLQDEELMPVALSRASYLAMVGESSSGIIACSDFVAGQFPEALQAPLRVLEPFDYTQAVEPRAFDDAGENVIQVIGTRSHRKHAVFALDVAKALALRGVPVRVDIIGSAHSADGRLGRMIQKRGVPVRVFDHHPDPYAINIATRTVTLVCATTEPYGLTVPESLRRGIPVVASRSGGPQGLLPSSLLYDVDDLEGCVRALEQVFAHYPDQVAQACQQYDTLAARIDRQSVTEALERTLTGALEHRVPIGSPRLDALVERVKPVLHLPLDTADMAAAIAKVGRREGVKQDAAAVVARIEAERQQPGTAVAEDLRRFDVVPFVMSAGMDRLYRHGLGLAVELAATCEDPGRLQMAAFIVSALDEWQREHQRSPRVLALGDGIGIDSLRFALAGFSVTYVDYDQSRMAEVAARHFDTVRASRRGRKLPVRVVDRVTHAYDAVVCLEVIEHVPDPAQFFEGVAGHVGEGGLLFISECFNGIENRWPTHLRSNESLAGMLPLMAPPTLDYVGTHPALPGKPFVFRRREADAPAAASCTDLLRQRTVERMLLQQRLDLGV